MRHYDLDDIALFGPFLDELGRDVGRGLAECLNLEEAPLPEVQEHPAIQRGKQTTLMQTLTWTMARGDSALRVRVDTYRFINPALGVIDNTMELSVEPRSAKAGLARLLFLLTTPALSALIGLLGWRLLQWDTNMTFGPWVFFGALLGAVGGVWLATAFPHRLGAVLEGRNAIASADRCLRVEEAAYGVVQAIVKTHQAETESLAAAATPDCAPAAEPGSLAEYATALIGDPDTALVRYGLLRASNRQVAAERFAWIEKDADRYGEYLDALSASESEAG